MITKEEKIRHRIVSTVRELEEVRDNLENPQTKLDYYTYDLLDKVISKLKVTLDIDLKL
jgi:hypothetical protein